MFRVIRSWPFTFVGLFTIGLFLVAEALHRAGMQSSGLEALYRVLRVIIIPIWLMRYVVVAIGGMLFGFAQSTGFPLWYDVLTIPFLLLPYIAVDLVLIRVWRRQHSNAHAL